METKLTKDSEKMLCILYKAYLEKKNAGASKRSAKSFGSSHDIHERFFPNRIFEDIDDNCRELSRANMLDCLWADDIAYDVYLSDEAISIMENRFKNSILALTDFIAKFV